MFNWLVSMLDWDAIMYIPNWIILGVTIAIMVVSFITIRPKDKATEEES